MVAAEAETASPEICDVTGSSAKPDPTNQLIRSKMREVQRASSLAVSTTALLIQKYSTKREAGLPIYKRWRFFAGVGLNIGSEVTLSPFAIYFAPLSLIAPLGGFGMIFNAILTHFGCRGGSGTNCLSVCR